MDRVLDETSSVKKRKHLRGAKDDQGNSVHVQRQVSKGERRAVFFQEGPKEGVIVLLACPSLKQWKVDIVVGAGGEYVHMCLCLRGSWCRGF